MANKIWKIVLVVVLILSFIVTFTACGSSSNSGIEIAMPHDNEYYIGSNIPVDMIVEEFEELGFTNIIKTEVDPWIYYFEIESIEIDKKKKFEEGDVFLSDATVEIKYYGGSMEDALIQELIIDQLYNNAKEMAGYEWEDLSDVREVRLGLSASLDNHSTGTCIELHSNDYGVIDWITVSVHKDNKEFLVEFVALLETSLIKSQEVQAWIESYSYSDEISDEVFGDANFSLSSDLFSEGEICLHIDALY